MVSQKMSYIKWRLLKITLQAPFLNVQKTFDRSRSSLGLHAMTFEQRSSSLVLHQMTSDHNRSELGIQDHSNEQVYRKKPSTQLKAETGVDTYAVRNHKLIADIEIDIMDPCINLLLLVKLMLPGITYYCWATAGLVNAVKPFWATAKAKTVNGEVQIQALVDGKKVIVTETSVRRALQLKDAEGTKCLPNATIFEQLTLMGYENLTQKLTFYKAFFSPQWKFLIHTILQCLSAKTTAWNEFKSEA
ncbi:hypothetical protein Tco_0201229 [Tanacetum coccineum]